MRPSTPSSDDRRRAAEKLAELLRQPQALRVLRLLQRTDLLSPSRVLRRDGGAGAGAVGMPDEGSREPRPISIWSPQQRADGVVFVRPEPGPFGDHYSQCREIPQRKREGRQRLCFFGESVAAGYLYAPHLTPASVLQFQLGDGWEVVDLARTNETLGGWIETLEACRQLSPDALVYFGGNNWNLLETPELSPYLPSVAGRQFLAEELRKGGVSALQDAARRRLKGVAGTALERAAAIAREMDAPMILVVPEVNLLDWEGRQPVHWLPGDGLRSWYRWLWEGEELLDLGDGEGAELRARRMLEVDGGSNPTSYRLLARALQQQGLWTAAREACQSEVDAESYATLCLLGAPRATRQVRELLLQSARDWDLGLVDLREVFQQELLRRGEVPIPGRRFFLDYCHLTAEGMVVAMAALARRLVGPSEPSGQDRDRGQREPPASTAPPPAPDSVEATAGLGAAIHTAHRWAGNKRGLLEYWCRQALAAAPETLETMTDLVDARTAPLPAVLTDAQRRNSLRRCPLGFQHGWRWRGLDVEVLEAVLGELGREHGDLAAELRRTIVDRLALTPEPRELCQERYSWDPLLRFYPEVMEVRDLQGRAPWRAPWPVSSFAFATDGGATVGLELCARLPPVPSCESAAPRLGEVTLALDGESVGAFELTPQWDRRELRLRVSRTPSSLHRLDLKWPIPAAPGEDPLAAAADRLELGVNADLHPVFGELWSLKARLF